MVLTGTMFNSVHPSPSAGDGYMRKGARLKSDAIHTGYHDESTAVYPDDHYVLCQQCGFLCNTSRDKRIADRGSGIQYTTEYVQAVNVTSYDGTPLGILLAITFYPYGDQNLTSLENPVVISGCPFCGSNNF